MHQHARKSRAALLSVLSNVTLIVFKVIVGIMMGSVSVISEAIHSGVDLVAAVIALVAVKEAAKPADDKHPFGHGKAENLSGTIEALLIFVAAVWIVFEAVKKMVHPGPLDDLGWGVGVMAVSALANTIVSHVLFKVGRETHSMALQADAWHLRTDVYTSAGVMAGLGLIWLGDRIFPSLGDKLHLIDPIAAIIVAGLILKAAIELTVQSARDLLDQKLPAAEEQIICDLLRGFRPQIMGMHRMRTRKAGTSRFIEFHMFVDGKMTVDEAHELSHEVARKIEERFPESSVNIHVEPCKGNCKHTCSETCVLTAEQREEVRRAKEAEKPAGNPERPST